MSLIPSVFTSFVIVCALWMLAIFQPNFALANNADKLSVTVKSNEQTQQIKSKSRVMSQSEKVLSSFHFESVQISAVSQRISLNQIDNLWQDFDRNKALQNSLKKKPSKVYVYYRDFSSDYGSAMVSIGYNSQEIKKPLSKINLPAARFQPILSKGKYDDVQIKQAWEKIDYRKNIAAVVEVYYLNADSLVSSTETFVSYN